MIGFEKELSAAITIVAESLTSALRNPSDTAQQEMAVLDAVIRDCSQIVDQPACAVRL
jgi:hypothetical protein